MSESEKENLENTHEDEAENNTSDNPQFEGNYEDKVLEEQYLTPPETEVGRVLSENAELKLALLQTKRANIRICYGRRYGSCHVHVAGGVPKI